MEINKAQERVIEIEREIASLPAGSITTKRVKNGTYFYHRINVNGKRKETYVDPETAAELKELINRRKTLEKELKALRPYSFRTASEGMYVREGANLTSLYNTDSRASEFHTYIRFGDALKKYAAPVAAYEKRDCIDDLKKYIYDESIEKVMILYGLRRTGKTTLIRQVIADMDEDDLRKTIFIQVKSGDTLADVNEDLRKLETAGYKYVFIDEVTLMKDFIEGAALFSDIFAASGMKIVLSGTDSLGFVFSEDEQLYDRCVMIHTTYIPYREFERVLGIKGIDEYIRFGGTMSLSGIDYNEDSLFANSTRANEYIDSAIAKNIQHSLQYYQNGGHFRNLRELYDKNELTSAINRIIEDMNHRFTVDVLDRIDVEAVTNSLKAALEILNIEEQKIAINENHAVEIREYLKLLDLIMSIDIRHIPNSGNKGSVEVITQPGIRYVQAEELIESIVSDSVFNELDIVERNAVLERIRSEIMGRMMEEIILLETRVANPKMQVFKLQFAVGEFDMVVFDPQNVSCKIYEIKHSAEAAYEQTRHLTDAEKCAETERNFGRITGKYVIYRGEHKLENGIEYLNVEEYLKQPV